MAPGAGAGYDLSRYSRQMLVHGLEPQLALQRASVLVVGAGALGCGCLPYLVGAGVGRVTVVDGDVVEVSNLHRQPLHSERGAEMRLNKAESAAARLRELNSTIDVVAVARHAAFDAETQALVDAHDVVVDCSDNVGTRYLLNDACVLSGTPLVSAAAIGCEGTLTRWHCGGGPCYRCVHPKPAAFEGRRRCADAGVLGPVPGALGTLQALDAVRLIQERAAAAVLGAAAAAAPAPKLRLFDGETLRAFGLPPRQPACAACGAEPSIASLADSKAWCVMQGIIVEDSGACFGALEAPPPVSVAELSMATCADLRDALGRGATIVDVRERVQFSICSIEGSVSVPLRTILSQPQSARNAVSNALEACSPSVPAEIFVICRRGNDSRRATNELIKLGFAGAKNVDGGLDVWRAQIDAALPNY